MFQIFVRLSWDLNGSASISFWDLEDIWLEKIEGKAVILLKTTFAHLSTSYLFYDVHILYIKHSRA